MKKRKHTKSKTTPPEKREEPNDIKITDKTANIIIITLIILFTTIYLLVGPHMTGYDEWRHMELTKSIKDGKGYTYFEVPFVRHPPLMALLASGMPVINATTTLLFSISWATLCLIAMWFLSKQILKKNTYAILAVILLALTPNIITRVDFFGMPLMNLLGFILYFSFYTKYLKTNKKRYAILSGIVLGLGLLTKVVFTLLIPTTIIILIYTHRKDIEIKSGKLLSRKNAVTHLKYTLVALIIAYAIYSPYAHYISINNLPSTSSIFSDEFFGKTNYALFDSSLNAKGASLASYFQYIKDFHKIFSIPIAILLIFALWYHTKKEKEDKTIANYLLITFLITFITFSIHGMKDERFIIQITPMVILFSLLYLPKLTRYFKLNEKTVISAIIILLILQSAPILHNLYKNNHTFEECKALDYLETHTDKNSAIIVYNYNYARFNAYMDGFYEWSGPPPLDNYTLMNSILYRPDYYIIFDNKKDKLDEPLFHLKTRESCVGIPDEGIKDKEKDIYKNMHVLIYKVNHTALDSLMKTAIKDAKIIEIKFKDQDNNPLNGVRIQTGPSVIPRPYRSRPDGTKIILAPGTTHHYYIFKVGYEQKRGTITTETDRYCINSKCYSYDEPVTIALKKTSLFSHGISFSRY